MLERLKLSKKSRIYCLIILLIIILAFLVAIPSLGRYQSKITTDNVSVWDGSISSSYRSGSGTEEDPYIISNGSELALLSENLKTTDYANTYFSIENDIVLNDGYFLYDDTNKLQYIKDNVTYYVKDYSNELYDNLNKEGNAISSINNFTSLNNFKGQIDGNSHTIYGLYIGNGESKDLSFFTNLEGNISNLYFTNSVIYGGSNTAGIAATATNANLNNVLYNGYVINNENETTESEVINIDDITLDSPNKVITPTIPDIKGIVTNITLTGTTNNTTGLTINGNAITTNDFSLTLDNYNSLEIVSNDYQNTSITNLKYEITYLSDTSAGLIGNATDTTLTNVINKADVYGNVLTSGLVSKGSNIEITNSYNHGDIYSSNISTGLVSIIEGTSFLTNSYNSGGLSSPNNIGLVGNVLNSTLDITNCFNATSSNYLINNNNNSTINVNNSYYTEGNTINNGLLTGTFYLTDISNLQNKSFLINTLSYNEFIDLDDLNTNPNNLFIYDNNYPLLYFDEVNSSNATINLGNHSYNNFSTNLESIKYTDNINATIEDTSTLIPNKELYYYVYEGVEPLSIDEVETLEFTPYTGIFEVSEMGEYIIYVKAVDYDNNVTYLNTDILVLDKTEAEVNITMNDYTFNSFKTSLDEVYTNKSETLSINATDDLSTITDVLYYITDEVKTKEELDEIEFIPYEGEIVLDNIGKNIVYVKVIDNYNYVTYVNTDYITIDGYEVNSIDNTNITDKSNVNLNITYESDKEYQEGYKHSLVSNTLLKENTTITIIDNINEKVYTYTTTDDDYGFNDNNKATYPFTLFKEVGKDDDTTYKEPSTGLINENYEVRLSFANTNIEAELLNINLSLVLEDENNNIILDTLEDTLKPFNVYKSKEASISLETPNTINNINYNSNSLTELEFTTKLNYQEINNSPIIDTTYQNKNLLLLIKLVDDEGNIVSKEDLKNISFKLNDSLYYPDSSGYIRINLSNNMNEYTGNLQIETTIDNSSLNEGTYYFEINTASSIDGIYEEEISTNTIEIPVIVDNEIDNYSFNVIDKSSSKIISKEKEEETLSFDIIKEQDINNANIRVSLHKKKNFTAYNQDYELIDLNEYITNDLELVGNNVYYAFKDNLDYLNTLELKFSPNSLGPGGYKLIFELYDNDTKIGTIDEKFIVK